MRDISIMWLMAIGLTLCGLAILWFTSGEWRSARHVDLGWMSQRWLSEHRAGSR